MKEMLPVEEARQLVLSKVKTLGAEEVELLQAVGRVLSQEIVAEDALPPFKRSAMDGYAVRSVDTWNKRMVALKVVEELPAGKVAQKNVVQDTCTKLMTGAPLPEGADAVVRREEVEREGELAIIPGHVAAGTNVDPAGSDIQAGKTLLQSGTIIGPGEAAFLASQGYAQVPVCRRPRVAVLSTGDELLDIDQSLAPGKIRNSNRYMLAAAVEAAGAEPVIYPSMADEIEATKDRLLQAGEETDLVLSTGGVSMGDFDLVRKALVEIADEPLFWKVQIKPGMPVIAVVRRDTIYLGLSGKPTGALLNFYLLAYSVIAKLGGKEKYFFPKVEALLQNDYPKASPGRNRYLWAQVCYDRGWKVTHLGGKELNSLLNYNALVEIPAGSGPLAKGQHVTVIPVKMPL